MTEFVLMERPRPSMFDLAMFGGGEKSSSWTLLRVQAGIATEAGQFTDEVVARRVVALLNRNGLVDPPMPEITS